MLILILALVATADPPPSARASTPQWAEETAARILEQLAAVEPTIEEVQSAAARASPNAAQIESLGNRVRTAAWLPKISAMYRHDQQNTRVIGLESGGSEVDYTRLGPGEAIEVKASWDLDQLLFSSAELQIASARAQLAKDREDRVERATRLYFERRKRLLDLAVAPPVSPQDRAEQELEIDALTANLDALTQGLFRQRRSK